MLVDGKHHVSCYADAVSVRINESDIHEVFIFVPAKLKVFLALGQILEVQVEVLLNFQLLLRTLCEHRLYLLTHRVLGKAGEPLEEGVGSQLPIEELPYLALEHRCSIVDFLCPLSAGLCDGLIYAAAYELIGIDHSSVEHLEHLHDLVQGLCVEGFGAVECVYLVGYCIDDIVHLLLVEDAEC